MVSEYQFVTASDFARGARHAKSVQYRLAKFPMAQSIWLPPLSDLNWAIYRAHLL